MERPRRIDSIDLLRGAIMIVMALDHVRDFLSPRASPTDLATTTVPLFFTRWITHFCAPGFMLLAGLSIGIQRSRGATRSALARFLVTRGLWLVVLEVTILRMAGFAFTVDVTHPLLLVIWALGACMIVMAAVVWLPSRVVLPLAAIGIVGHNLLDHVDSTSLPWLVLHRPGLFELGPFHGIVGYPLIPWVFVMMLGYALAPIFSWDAARRRRVLLAAGTLMVVAFVVVRATNVYGDPFPWASQPRGAAYTFLSFLNCTKYPPSLCFLLMTLGPLFIGLAALENVRAPVVVTYGRVPFFYYVLHIPLIHLVAIVYAQVSIGRSDFLIDMNPITAFDNVPAYGMSLAGTFAVWIAVVAALYVPCRWYAAVKARSRSPWLSYL
ncbi:MAG: DUF1624 domain-containing protein [Deltaproteobacteria bacterium]|nr:DUF1624 domain-containing protein [Deltaproteobacteria bacterium]